MSLSAIDTVLRAMHGGPGLEEGCCNQVARILGFPRQPCWTVWELADKGIGGWSRNRTGVDGFAVRCITTLPSSRAASGAAILPRSPFAEPSLRVVGSCLRPSSKVGHAARR